MADSAITRGARAALVLCAAMGGWAVYDWDVPLFFFVTSLASFLLAPVAERYVGSALAGGMRGFAAAVGVGALALLAF